MGHVVKLVDGQLTYQGMLSSQEIATIDDILFALRIEIPEVEADLSEKYGDSVFYKYYLGQFLGTLLAKYNIPQSEQRLFWDEIKHFASKEVRKRGEGKTTATRSFYQQCYILSQQDVELVKKLSWRQWQGLLDRVSIREDPRIYDWLRKVDYKISEHDWREFQKALNLFLKNKDTSVFDDEELLAIYDSLMYMCVFWREHFPSFAKKHGVMSKQPPRALTKSYYSLCFTMKKKAGVPAVTHAICKTAFSEITDVIA